jgi:hypothetical protein
VQDIANKLKCDVNVLKNMFDITGCFSIYFVINVCFGYFLCAVTPVNRSGSSLWLGKFTEFFIHITIFSWFEYPSSWIWFVIFLKSL